MLTSAHCLNYYFNSRVSLSGLWVAAGADHDLQNILCNKFDDSVLICNEEDESKYTKKVSSIHMHPRFLFAQNVSSKEYIINDIALLQLKSPFELSEEVNILPGCLFESTDRSFDDLLLVAG